MLWPASFAPGEAPAVAVEAYTRSPGAKGSSACCVVALEGSHGHCSSRFRTDGCSRCRPRPDYALFKAAHVYEGQPKMLVWAIPGFGRARSAASSSHSCLSAFAIAYEFLPSSPTHGRRFARTAPIGSCDGNATSTGLLRADRCADTCGRTGMTLHGSASTPSRQARSRRWRAHPSAGASTTAGHDGRDDAGPRLQRHDDAHDHARLGQGDHQGLDGHGPRHGRRQGIGPGSEHEARGQEPFTYQRRRRRRHQGGDQGCWHEGRRGAGS